MEALRCIFPGEIEVSGTGPPKIGTICLVVRANPPSIDFRGGYAPPGVPPPVHGPTPIRGPTDANLEVTPPFLFVGSNVAGRVLPGARDLPVNRTYW